MIDLGDVHRIEATVRDADGQLVDPTTADLTVTLPDGSTDTPPVPLPSTSPGQLRVSYQTVQFGLHRWRMATAGPTSAYADAFNVVDSTWPALVGLTEVKEHLNIASSDTSEDDELRGFILSASAVVDDIVGVTAKRTITETNSGGERHIVLTHSPVRQVTEVRVDGEVVDAGDYTVSPSGLLARRSGRWPSGFHNVETVYIAGRDVMPANLIDATKELIRINFRPQQGGNYSAFDGGAGDDFGNAGLEASLQGNLRLGFFIPNTVIQRLQPDQRGPVVL